MPRLALPPWRALPASLALVAALGPAGCSGLPRGERVTRPAVVRGELERSTGIGLNEVGESNIFGTIPNVEATYSGGDARESLLVIVFDSPKATWQPLGRRPVYPQGTGVVRRDNVVVFYSLAAGGPDRRPQIMQALERLPRA